MTLIVPSSRFIRTTIVALALSATRSALAADVAPPTAPSDDGAPLAHRIATTFAHDTAGVVSFHSHSVLTISAPLVGRSIVDDAWYVYADGTLAASSRRTDPRQPPLRDPYRERYLGEYAFHIVGCAECAAGIVALAYDSPSHDVAHAHGVFYVDIASAHIESGSETPYALPWPTKSGRLEARWGGAAEGWFPLHVDGTFSGATAPSSGARITCNR